MQIQVAKLRDGLGLLKNVVPRKPTLDILKNVCLGNGEIRATDLETTVVIPFPEADTPCLLPYNIILKMLQYTNGGEYLTITPEDKNVALEWSEGRTSLNVEDVNEYPALQEFKEVVGADLDSDALVAAMMSVLLYAATEDSRPVLQGVILKLGDPFHVMAGDGFRLAYQILPLTFPEEKITVVPIGTTKAFAHIWEKTPRVARATDSLVANITAKKPVHLSFNDTLGIRFTFDKMATIYAKTIDGNPPEFLKLIPEEEPVFRSHFMANDLQVAAQRAGNIASRTSNVLRMLFDEGKVIVEAIADEQEIQSTVRTFNSTGEPYKLGLNNLYLLDYLNGKTGVVKIECHGDGHPVIFQCQNTPRVIIMPMNVNWDGTPPEDETPADEDAAADESAQNPEETETESDTPEDETAETEPEPVEEEVNPEVSQEEEPAAVTAAAEPKKPKGKRKKA